MLVFYCKIALKAFKNLKKIPPPAVGAQQRVQIRYNLDIPIDFYQSAPQARKIFGIWSDY